MESFPQLATELQGLLGVSVHPQPEPLACPAQPLVPSDEPRRGHRGDAGAASRLLGLQRLPGGPGRAASAHFQMSVRLRGRGVGLHGLRLCLIVTSRLGHVVSAGLGQVPGSATSRAFTRVCGLSREGLGTELGPRGVPPGRGLLRFPLGSCQSWLSLKPGESLAPAGRGREGSAAGGGSGSGQQEQEASGPAQVHAWSWRWPGLSPGVSPHIWPAPQRASWGRLRLPWPLPAAVLHQSRRLGRSLSFLGARTLRLLPLQSPRCCTRLLK